MEIQRVSREDMMKYGPDIGTIRTMMAEISALRKQIIDLKLKHGEKISPSDLGMS